MTTWPLTRSLPLVKHPLCGPVRDRQLSPTPHVRCVTSTLAAGPSHPICSRTESRYLARHQASSCVGWLWISLPGFARFGSSLLWFLSSSSEESRIAVGYDGGPACTLFLDIWVYPLFSHHLVEACPTPNHFCPFLHLSLWLPWLLTSFPELWFYLPWVTYVHLCMKRLSDFHLRPLGCPGCSSPACVSP